MAVIIRKRLYSTLLRKKNTHNSSTYNRTFIPHQVVLRKQNVYTVYLITQEKNKASMKEITGILIKKSKMQNLTNLHLLSLKKYNNIYLSFFKEAPNIIIKYKI